MRERSTNDTTPNADVASLATRLTDVVAGLGPMVIAFSGGVDSALVVAAAGRVSAGSSLAVTADSASLAEGELADCETLATKLGVPWQRATTTELDDDRYTRNDTDRCFWCKSALMDQLDPIATEREATVVLGVNLDDLGEHRPGQNAASERGARFPLVDAGFTKSDVRLLASAWDVPVWDRPSMPCLASRVPYGTAVTVPLLSRIDRAEAALKALGFRDVRVRHYDDTARIEVPAKDISHAAANASAIADSLQSLGYRYVTLDLAGLRSGNLNHVLAPADAKTDG